MSDLVFSKISKPECWDLEPYYIIFKNGKPDGAEDFILAFNAMRDALEYIEGNCEYGMNGECLPKCDACTARETLIKAGFQPFGEK